MACLYFQQGGRRDTTGKGKTMETVAGGKEIYWLWEVVIVSKTLYWFLSVALLSMVIMK